MIMKWEKDNGMWWLDTPYGMHCVHFNLATKNWDWSVQTAEENDHYDLGQFKTRKEAQEAAEVFVTKYDGKTYAEVLTVFKQYHEVTLPVIKSMAKNTMRWERISLWVFIAAVCWLILSHL